MYGLSDALKPLSAAEEQVLLAVWACRLPSSRREISDKLADKGWVKRGKEQNRNVYTPTVTRRAYGVWCMRQRLDVLFDGDLTEAVRALVSESGCGQSELEQAIAVLNEKYAEAEEYDLYDPYG